MSKSRREFLNTSVRAGAAMSAFAHPAFSAALELPLGPAVPSEKPLHPLNILILGGTSFIGPHLIAYAMNRGHSITTFTRGRTEPTVHKALFKSVEQFVGDRENDLEALRGRTWDAVIDNSGRQVEWTEASAELLQDSVDLYVYTSSTGVYYPYLGSDISERTQPVLAVPEGEDAQGSAYGYGVMKANSELAARRAFGDHRTIVVRPTYIMGPGDSTDRFAYWPVRLSRGGEVLVPGRSADPVQYIDVRDLAGWMIRLIENRTIGTYNAVGPSSTTGLHAFVHGAHAAFSSPASFVMVPDYDFLREHRVGFVVPWIMPVGNNAGSALVNNRLAIDNGLTFTPLAQSVRDIYEWWHSDAVTDERRDNMVSGERSLIAREAAIIAAWKAL